MTTVHSGSRLSLSPVQPGWVESRVVRSGPAVVLLHRSPGEPWQHDWTYERSDLPETLELLLTAQTGGEGDRADLIAEFDWLDVQPAPITAAEGAALAGGDLRPEQVLTNLSV